MSALREAARNLKLVCRKLDGLRFAGTDQNPFGIRDLLFSATAAVERASATDAEPLGWEAHTGEDYCVVMRPDETTDQACIQVNNSELAEKIAAALNAGGVQ